MEAPGRILLIRPSALGDVCRTVPVLVSLRRAYPGARIDWLVQDTFADAVRAHPALTGVLPFPRRALGEAMRGARFGEVSRFLGLLRAPSYDLVLDAQGLFRSAWFAWATRSPRRVGHRGARELGWLFYTECERGSEGRHTVDRMLALVAAAGVEPCREMRLHTPAPEREQALADPALAGPFALLAPATRWPGKQWPADRFAAVAEGLLREGLVERVVLVGTKGEREQCGPLLALAAREPRVLDRMGGTTVAGLMAMIERSALVVANDSAAVHMAVGFDRPLVALYGPTRVGLVGPYGRDADVLQHVTAGDRLDHKDHHAGRLQMERIGVDEVLDACTDRLSRADARTLS
ncbi:MAG: glycosyltransferase family 9 protein [Phycisphaerales bacterium]|nr:glycosyltransferase family 9 protein [Phycisphaerales bacterium]